MLLHLLLLLLKHLLLHRVHAGLHLLLLGLIRLVLLDTSKEVLRLEKFGVVLRYALLLHLLEFHKNFVYLLLGHGYRQRPRSSMLLDRRGRSLNRRHDCQTLNNVLLDASESTGTIVQLFYHVTVIISLAID